MSDSLDDFFAKKDKKKKTKTKITNNDLMTTEEEKKTKKSKGKKNKESGEAKPAVAATNNEPAVAQKQPEDEDWSEYAEEKETDYSGLRIQSIQIRDEDQDQGDKEREKGGDGEEGDEDQEQTDGPSGPWAPLERPVPVQKQPEPEPPKKEEPVIPNVKSGKYVPPSLRNQPSTNMEPAPLVRRMRKKEAPNLRSEEDFPTLGAGPSDDLAGAWGSGAKFEKVRSGGRQVDDQSSRGPKLELGNKWDLLQGGAD